MGEGEAGGTGHRKEAPLTNESQDPDTCLQLSGVSAEDLQLKACLSHGKRLIPTLSAHFDPYSDYPLPPPPISTVGSGSTQKEREENREEMSLGRSADSCFTIIHKAVKFSYNWGLLF